MIAGMRSHAPALGPDSAHRPGLVRLAWGTAILATSFGVLFLVLLAVNSADPRIDAYQYWGASAVIVILFPVIGALIVSRFPANLLGWVFLLIGLATGAGDFATEYARYTTDVDPGALPGGVFAAWVSSYMSDLGYFSLVLIPLLFPNGRPLNERWRLVIGVVAGAIALNVLARAILPGPLQGFGEIENPLGVPALGGTPQLAIDATLPVLPLGLAAGILCLILRYQRADSTGRLQLKWFVLAVALQPVGLIGNTIFPELAWLIGGISVALIPIAIGVAVLRYRLYDVDVVINRALVYGTLSAGVIGLYVLVVGGAGALLQSNRSSLALSIVAAGLVAVLFQPLRERLQRAVNHLMYGERDDPYGVLSRLGQRLRATISPDEVLPTIVESVARALKLPYVAILLRTDDGSVTTAAEFGRRTDDAPLVLPLAYGTEPVGQLVLSPRAPGDPFSSTDRRLLNDLARQAETAIYAVRVTNDLQRSRERLVNVREEERRRLRRDLHDGLGPRLATLTLKLDAARNLLTSQPETAKALLVELKEQTQAAVTDIRRLVYDLRPPSLDELGLIPAIREQATSYSQNGLRVTVNGPDRLPPLPAAVEVAAYRITQEALTNVVRHARADHCHITLALNGALTIEVTDDGVGLPAGSRAGVGLTSMRERAVELGGRLTVEALPAGGTRILAHLPLPSTERAP
jgi:two-component system, NarL family, sensor kinase